MDLKVGFIGAGNMGSAILKGIVASGMVGADKVFVYDIDTAKVEVLKKETGVNAAVDSREVVEQSDLVILAVKPNMVVPVLEGCREKFAGGKILVSIAVGIPIEVYSSVVGQEAKIVRAMPNTPALVGEGMTVVSFSNNISPEEKSAVLGLFQCVGKVEVLEERLMNEVTALTGSSPAYVFMFVEAMADAAVQSGIPRSLAYRLGAQAVLGSARMVLETGKHPGELKDQVCSPGGTTIEAVSMLEKLGFRFAVMDAMKECTRKAREMSSSIKQRNG